MYSSKEFWLYSTFLQIVASETLALGASDKNLSTVLNTQVKPKKSRMSLRTVLPKFLRVTNIRLFSSIDGLISNKHLWVIFPSKAYLKASNKTPQQQWLNEQNNNSARVSHFQRATTLHVQHTFWYISLFFSAPARLKVSQSENEFKKVKIHIYWFNCPFSLHT